MLKRKSELQKRTMSSDYRYVRSKKRKWYYAAGSIITAAVMIVTFYALMMPAITMVREPSCGMEEHIHDVSCYSALSTELSESTDDAENINSAEEFVLSCGKEEHTHTDSCYLQDDITEVTTEEEALAEEEIIEQITSDNDSAEDIQPVEDAEQTVEEELNESQSEDEIPEQIISGSVEVNEYEETEENVTEEEIELPSLSGSMMKQVEIASDDSSDKLILTDEGDDATIKNMSLSYKCPDITPAMTEWELITDDVTIHADDSLELYFEYENVHISDVKQSNYKMYYPLPDWMQEADDSQVVNLVDKDSKPIGELTTEDGYLVASFYKTWLDAQTSASVLNGNISMNASLSVDYVKNSTLKIGSVTIHVNYTAGTWESTYGTIDIDKSNAKYIEMSDGYDILQYTLTVRTGDTNMGDVEVVDAFSNSQVSNYIQEIVGITDTEAEITNTVSGLSETSDIDSYSHGTVRYTDNTLFWNIGEMQANETRTLTYQVKLKKEFTGIYRKNAVVFSNKAVISSNGIERDEASSVFNAYATISTYKNKLSYTPDEDGIGGTITYAVKVTANSSNTYTLDNMKIYDFFIDKNNKWAFTNLDVSLLTDSFVLYDGDATSEAKKNDLDNSGKKQSISDITVSYDSSASYIGTCDECDAANNNQGRFSAFTCYIGDLKPGQSKTLVYSVKVHDSLYLSNNGQFTITNRATIYDDDTKHKVTTSPNNGNIDAYISSDTITYSIWEKKFTGIFQEKNETIQMDGNVYPASDSSVTSFNVSTGNYKYRVVVNQYGELDVHSVSLKDTLSSYMQYKGYLRVDEYDTLEAETLSSETSVFTEPILRTAWMNIDGLTKFDFTLSDMGFSGEHAYVLTYYTRITYDGDALKVDVSNSFNMSGSIYGTGGRVYILSGIGVSVSMQAVTSTSCQAEKYKWYYERPFLNDTSQWNKGALYWYIKITGTEIPADTTFEDKVTDSNHKLVEPDSFVGVYITDSGTELTDVESLQNDAIELDSSKYDLTWNTDNNTLDIHFPNYIEIGSDQTIYIVIKTDVVNYPTNGNTITYSNSLLQKTGDKSFQSVGTPATFPITGVQTSRKTASNVFTYDGSTYTRIGGSSTVNNGAWGNYAIAGIKTADKRYQMIKKAGTYIEYEMDTCINGYLSGNVEFSDTLQEGLEPVFLRNSWYNQGSGSFIPTAECVEIEELENDPDWTRYQMGNKAYSNATTELIYYYNSTTREIRWKISNVKVPSGGYIRFQLVVEVVDEQVLMGVKKGEYINTITVTQDGRYVEKTTSGTVTVSRNALTKAINGKATGFTIPFKIIVNDIGEDLLSNSDEITLVDEMSASLTVDIPTIRVEDANGNEVRNVKIGLEETETTTYLKITVPDNMKLVITYDAKVNAAEGTSVSISNVAHWEGYDPAPASTVENKSFTYELKGMATVGGHASLKLTKRDADDIMTTLPGAVYSMQAAELQSDGTYKLVGTEYTGTTDENGEVYFAADDDTWMNYDQIYCLTEIQAPDGYLLDSTPHYILLATKGNVEEYPASVKVQRNTNQYVFEAIDTAKPAYRIPSAGGMGTYPIQLAGAALITAAVGYGCVTKIKRKKKN